MDSFLNELWLLIPLQNFNLLFFVVMLLLPWWYFLYLWLKHLFDPTLDFCGKQNYTVTFCNKPIFQCIRTKHAARNILSQPQLQLAWPYHSLAAYVQLEGCFPFTEWSETHHETRRQLTQLFRSLKLKPRLKQFENGFLIQLIRTGQLNVAWFEYLFHVIVPPLCGSEITLEQFRHQYQQYKRYMHAFFHRSVFQWPIIGPYCSRLWAKWYFPHLDVASLSTSSPLFSLLNQRPQYHLLFCFVFEFLYEMGLEVIHQSIQIASNPSYPQQVNEPQNDHDLQNANEISRSNVLERKMTWSDHMSHVSLMTTFMPRAFFAPWRLRWNGTCLVAVNLVDSQSLFSTGLRTCLGIGLASELLTHLTRLIRTSKFSWTWEEGHNVLVRTHPTRPICESLLRVKLHLSSRELQLPSIRSPNMVQPLFHVTSITWHPVLMTYIVHELSQHVTRYLETHRLSAQDAVLVAPEARAWLFASSVAHQVGIPLAVIRKRGKEKGTEVYHRGYSTAYSVDEMEISIHSPLTDRHVILLDDGVSSGGSILAMYSLIREKWPTAHVNLSLSVLLYGNEKKPLPRLPTTHIYLFEMDHSVTS